MPKSNKSTVIKITNSDRAATLVAQVDTLAKKREKWEAGAFKASNDQLYDILAECHKMLQTLSGNSGLKKAFDTALKDAGYKFRSNTSWELKVVKAVFGEENNRHYAYVRALKIARDDQGGVPSGKTFQSWVRDNGGIEEIRIKPKGGLSQADKAQLAREKADEHFATASVIGSRFDPDSSLQPAHNEDFRFSVALVRVDSDGKAGIVFGTNKAAVVRTVLKVAGDALTKKQEQEAPAKAERTKQEKRDAILAELNALDAADDDDDVQDIAA
jgi:hypothetical protein